MIGLKTLGDKAVCGEFRFDLMLAPGEIAIHITFSLYAIYALTVAARGLLRKGLN